MKVLEKLVLKEKTFGCELIKEKEFMMKLPYKEIFPNSNNFDKVLVQGIVDLIVKSEKGNGSEFTIQLKDAIL